MLPMRAFTKSFDALRLCDGILRNGNSVRRVYKNPLVPREFPENAQTACSIGVYERRSADPWLPALCPLGDQPAIPSPWRHSGSELFASPFPSGHFPYMPYLPIVPVQSPVDNTTSRLPSIWNVEKLDPIPTSSVPIEAPTLEHLKIEKLAARLVRQRRRKMKKHQYKKLRKRMGLVFDRSKNRRRMRRLKVFYAEQELILTKARNFSPEMYVRSYIAAAKASIIERASPPPKPVYKKPAPWKPKVFR